jgi:hypothetical protein
MPAADPLDGAATYRVEILIVEGEGASEELMSRRSDDAWKPASDVRATFSDPEAGSRASSRSARPRDVAEATRADADLPAPDGAEGRILPAPLPSAAEPGELSLRDRLASHADVDILSAPKVTVFEEQEATIYMATQEIFDYLVPLEDGKFEARNTEPLELGIRISFAVTPTEDAGAVVLSPLQIEVTSLDGREPVKGLDLEAGKPIVSSRSLKTTVPLRLGEDRLLPIPSGPERKAAVILRVERMELEAERPTEE